LDGALLLPQYTSVGPEVRQGGPLPLGIENKLSRRRDVTFGDNSRLRPGHAAENFSAEHRTAVSPLKNETTAKLGMKTNGSADGTTTTWRNPLRIDTYGAIAMVLRGSK